MYSQSFKMAWQAISASKMRSFLTMLGIIIGVIALVVLVSLASGATDSVTNEINNLGSNLLSVTITNDKGNPVRMNDINGFAQSEEIALVAPMAQLNSTAKNGYESETATIYGTTASYQQIQNLELESGRFIKTADVDNNSYVAVISQELAEDLYGSTNLVGGTISLDGRNFKIVGVLAENNNMMSLGSSSNVYIPYTVAGRMSGAGLNIQNFYATGTNPDSMDGAEAAMENMLLTRLRQDDEAYSIMNVSSIMDAMDSIMGTMTLMLGGIAAISLLVGGIGIMNIMLVSVTERTREIGIRKAIGASRRSIMVQFIIEALMVSLIGCLIGIVLSWGILEIVNVVAAGTLHFTLSADVVIMAAAFSTAIGVIFGVYPANKAAKMNPIQALRYE